MDKLSTALNHFAVSAGLFYSGDLCGSNSFGADNICDGHLHYLKQGSLGIEINGGERQTVHGPAVIFFPVPTIYTLTARDVDRTQVVCASVQYGSGIRNPIASSLPKLMVVGLDEVDGMEAVGELLVNEAFQQRDAREAMLNRLLEMVVISLIRHVIDKQIVSRGMLAGLAHPQLSKVILAIHDAPQRNWSVQELADLAAMSRSKFSKVFHDWVGVPVGEYIVSWRMAVAQEYLSNGKPVDWVAGAVGYESSSAFAKMFRKQTGTSPMAWLKTLNGNGEIGVATW